MRDGYCVYKHTSPSGKVYIGITSRKPEYRWDNGKGYKDSPAFANAIEKYGWENIAHEVLLRGLSEREANEAEIQLIARYQANNRLYGYNVASGGKGANGFRHTAETRARMSLRVRGAGHPMYGKTFSEESRRKMSEAHIGVKLPQITRQKMSAARTGAANWRSRKVQQLTPDGQCVAEYVSTTAAAKAIGCNQTLISQRCRGIGKTGRGFIWRFADQGKE